MTIIPKFVRRQISHRPNLVRIFENISWLFIDKILRMGVGLLVGAWIARYLGPDQFGVLNFAFALVGLYTVLAGLGLQSIVVRDLVRDPATKHETLSTAAALQFVSGLLTYALLLGTIFWIRPDDALVQSLVAIMGSLVLFKSSDVAACWFESQVQSKYTVWVQNSAFLFFAVVKVLLVLSAAPLVSFIWAVMLEGLLVAIAMCTMLFLRGPWLQIASVSFARARVLLTESWPLLLSGAITLFYMKIDLIMLSQIRGNEEAGIYSAATRLSEVWYFIPLAIVASVFPAILHAKSRSETEYNSRMQDLYGVLIVVSVAVAIPMTFLAEPIVGLLFGEAYLSAGSVLAIHIWASVFVCLGVAGSRWFLAENRQISIFQRAIVGSVVNVVLNLFLIPKYGATGAACATIAANFAAAYLFDMFDPTTRQMFLMKSRAFNLGSTFLRWR